MEVDVLLEALSRHGRPMDRDALERLVGENDKQRFAFSSDGLRIRASQGHSVEVALGYAATTPPDLLYHGTVERFLASIQVEGLVRATRQHVSELSSPGEQTAPARGPMKWVAPIAAQWSRFSGRLRQNRSRSCRTPVRA